MHIHEGVMFNFADRQRLRRNKLRRLFYWYGLLILWLSWYLVNGRFNDVTNCVKCDKGGGVPRLGLMGALA